MGPEKYTHNSTEKQDERWTHTATQTHTEKSYTVHGKKHTQTVWVINGETVKITSEIHPEPSSQHWRSIIIYW